MDLIADLAQLGDGLAEIAAGSVEVALHLRGCAAQAQRFGVGDTIAGGVGPFETSASTSRACGSARVSTRPSAISSSATCSVASSGSRPAPDRSPRARGGGRPADTSRSPPARAA